MAQQLHFERHLLGGSSQSLKLAFIVDPLADLKAWKDSSVAMMRAAEKHGHDVFAIEASTLAWRKPDSAHAGGVSGEAMHLLLRPDDHDWYRETGRERQPLRAFDAVIMRKDPPFDFEYLTATWLLERAEADGVRVVNRPRALRDHSEKLAIMDFPDFAPPTVVSREAVQIHHFIDEQRDVILKPLDGMGGMGIFRVGPDGLNLGSITETLNRGGAQSLMVQKFLPEITQGDKRVLIIGGQPVPFCLARIPQGSEVRGNLAAGGKGVARPLSERDFEIAHALGPILQDRGLLLAGVDVIGDYVTEINVTSPTCFQEIQQQTGCDVASLFIDALEAAMNKKDG